MSKLKKFHVPYGMTPNNLLNHKGISLKAKGLFAFMQSKPEDWKFSGKLIATQCKESVDSILSGLKELEDFGYLVREKKPTAKGYVITYYLHEYVESQNVKDSEKPRLDFTPLEIETDEKPRGEKPALEKPRGENPTLDFPSLEIPTLENPASISNKEESKKELINKEKERGKNEKFFPPSLSDVIEFFKKENITASAENFFNHWESVGWKKSKGQQIVKWESLVPKWVKDELPAREKKSATKQVIETVSPKKQEERNQLFEVFKKKTRGFVVQLQQDASALETARLKFNQECNHPFEFNSQAVYNEISYYQSSLVSFFNWFKIQKHYSELFSETPNKHHAKAQLIEN